MKACKGKVSQLAPCWTKHYLTTAGPHIVTNLTNNCGLHKHYVISLYWIHV